MVSKRLTKHLIQYLETLSDDELEAHRQNTLKQIDNLTSIDLRRDARLGLKLIEEEIIARSEIDKACKK